MKWRLRFVWMKARPLATFLMLVAVPFLPVVPWVLAAGPDPGTISLPPSSPEVVSLPSPISQGAAESEMFRGPSPPLDPRAIRKLARGWELSAIDGSGWKLLMTNRFAVRGDIRSDDLRAVGAFAERFLDAVHERLKGDLTDLRLSIRVFGNEEEFQQWASCHEVRADGWFYDSRGSEIAILFGPGTDVSAFCVRLMRGVALEYADRVLEYGGPPHIAEGVAAWFADYDVTKHGVSPKRPRGDADGLFRIPDPSTLEAAWKSWSEGNLSAVAPQELTGRDKNRAKGER